MLGHGEGQLQRGEGSRRRAAAWTGVLRNPDAKASHPFWFAFANGKGMKAHPSGGPAP